MDVGERVLERLTALGISQSELARRVKLSQPTIHNLIHRSKRGSAHLHRVARALRTTPEYLAGETDDPNEGAAPEPELSAEEAQLLDLYRQLSSKDRSALKHLIGRMAEEE